MPRSGPVANVNDLPVGVPVITGTVTEDQTLTADTSGISDADGLGAFSYQWLRNGAAITGATGSSYTLGDADVGQQISVQVFYTDGHGISEGPLTSAQVGPVANVNDLPAGVPVITGTVTEDQTLTADTSGISDADGLGAFSYRWLRNGAAITGATGTTYTLTDADVGQQISVEVSYTDAQGTPETLTSAQTAAVANLNDAPVGLPVDHGHGDRRPDPDRGHQRHQRCGRAGRVQLSVVAKRCGDWRRHEQHVRAGRCGCRHPDQRAGELHRRSGHARDR